MFYVFLVGLSKATLRCYTSICDGIILGFLLQNGLRLILIAAILKSMDNFQRDKIIMKKKIFLLVCIQALQSTAKKRDYSVLWVFDNLQRGILGYDIDALHSIF